MQKEAIAEFNALPNATPFKDGILQVLSNFFALLEARRDLTSEDQELAMQLSPLYLERLQAATEQGIERGIEQGIEREISLVIKQLRRRLGTIAPEIEQRVRRLPIDRAEALGEALFDLESEADLVEWLDRAEVL